MSLFVRELTVNDEKAFFEGMKLWSEADRSWYTFAWKPGMSYQEMLTILNDERLGRNLALGRVAHTMLYAFLDGQIIGRVSIRHSLNDFLLRRGGHIGYAVAEGFRGQGYATQLMKAGMSYCKDVLGLSQILVTCDDGNTPSWKIIEKFKARLENKIDDEGKTIRRYWVML
jgi:predicted acetyltransferase